MFLLTVIFNMLSSSGLAQVWPACSVSKGLPCAAHSAVHLNKEFFAAVVNKFSWLPSQTSAIGTYIKSSELTLSDLFYFSFIRAKVCKNTIIILRDFPVTILNAFLVSRIHATTQYVSSQFVLLNRANNTEQNDAVLCFTTRSKVGLKTFLF
jgi:hypothetical protein